MYLCASPFRVCSLKSYENMSSTGHVQVIGGDDLESLRGKNILVVEDMIDSGKTICRLLDTLKPYGPRCVRVARSDHACVRVCAPMRMHPWLHPCLRTCVVARLHACMHVCLLACLRACLLACMLAR